VLLNTEKVGRLPDGMLKVSQRVIQGNSGTQGMPELEFSGRVCDMVWEQGVLLPIGLVGLADVASVSVTIVLPALGRESEAMKVGKGSYVKDGKTREVVPEGHIGIPSIMHGSVGWGHIRVTAVLVGLL